ncbi:hypothetical protein DXC08_03940 [Clostridium sp. OM07-9AC]|nr:hypothetical protein DXC08_03940 [Clostridium sp. OM07-9AC]
MQKLSAIISDGNLTAPSANVVNSSKNSGDFQKIMTDMKNSRMVRMLWKARPEQQRKRTL